MLIFFYGAIEFSYGFVGWFCVCVSFSVMVVGEGVYVVFVASERSNTHVLASCFLKIFFDPLCRNLQREDGPLDSRIFLLL